MAGLEPVRVLPVLVDAGDLIADPTLLRAWAATFTTTDEITLVATADDVEAVAEQLGEQAAALWPDGTGPDLLLTACPPLLSTRPLARYGHSRPSGDERFLPRYDAHSIAALAAFAQRLWEHERPCDMPTTAKGRLLIVVDQFYPSVGGTEFVAEASGVALTKRGWQVEIATLPNQERTKLDRRGLRIHELADPRSEILGVVERGRFDAVLAFSDPRTWPVTFTMQIPTDERKRIVVPCTNADGYRFLKENTDYRETFSALAKTVDGYGVMSRNSWDVRFAAEEAIPYCYIPNAVDYTEPDAPFRERIGLDETTPLLLHVANFWPEKNHLELLAELRRTAGDWHLVLIGRPSTGKPELAEEIFAAAELDTRVTIIPGAHPATVSAAMSEADVLLLPSRAEGAPLVLLEAMSHSLPWIATPDCGAALDHAGGLIAPVDRFPQLIGKLLASSEARAALGESGKRHWQMSYTYEVVAERLEQLVLGQPLTVDDAPEDAIAATAQVRAALGL